MERSYCNCGMPLPKNWIREGKPYACVVCGRGWRGGTGTPVPVNEAMMTPSRWRAEAEYQSWFVKSFMGIDESVLVQRLREQLAAGGAASMTGVPNREDKIDWPEPAAYIVSRAMADDCLHWTPNPKALRNEALFTETQVAQMLRKNNKTK
jgi:hypothetical protein